MKLRKSRWEREEDDGEEEYRSTRLELKKGR